MTFPLGGSSFTVQTNKKLKLFKNLITITTISAKKKFLNNVIMIFGVNEVSSLRIANLLAYTSFRFHRGIFIK